MMDVSQTTRLWASLSPRLAKPASGHLPLDEEGSRPVRQKRRIKGNNMKRNFDPEISVGTGSIESKTGREVE